MGSYLYQQSIKEMEPMSKFLLKFSMALCAEFNRDPKMQKVQGIWLNQKSKIHFEQP